MITNEERDRLPRPDFFKGHIGWDNNGNPINENDKVRVVVEDDSRKNNPKYNHCSVGKIGTVVEHFTQWIVGVRFEDDGETVGCVDYYLEVIN